MHTPNHKPQEALVVLAAMGPQQQQHQAAAAEAAADTVEPAPLQLVVAAVRDRMVLSAVLVVVLAVGLALTAGHGID